MASTCARAQGLHSSIFVATPGTKRTRLPRSHPHCCRRPSFTDGVVVVLPKRVANKRGSSSLYDSKASTGEKQLSDLDEQLKSLVEADAGDKPQKADPSRLKRLDDELSFLVGDDSNKVRAARRQEVVDKIANLGPSYSTPIRDSEDKPVELPLFKGQFWVSTAIALSVVTVITNVLFVMIFGTETYK